MPKGKGLWPAMWMLPTEKKYGEWAASGEIDICEARGQETGRIEGTLHYGNVWPNNRHDGSTMTSFADSDDLSGDFHVYTLEWEEWEMRWYLDDNLFAVQNLNRSFYETPDTVDPYTANGQPWDEYFHIMLNLAVGGGYFPWPYTGPDAGNPAFTNPSLEVDYVRVFQLPPPPPPKGRDRSASIILAIITFTIVGASLIAIGWHAVWLDGQAKLERYAPQTDVEMEQDGELTFSPVKQDLEEAPSP